MPLKLLQCTKVCMQAKPEKLKQMNIIWLLLRVSGIIIEAQTIKYILTLT